MNFIRGGSRIYRDTPISLNAGLEGPGGAPEAGDPGAGQTTIPGDTYMTALLKLIPTEVISIYMAIRDSAAQHDFVTGWFFLCLVTCVILRSYSSVPPGGAFGLRAVQWEGVVVSTVAFVLWASSIGPDQPWPLLHLQQWLAAALAALFGVLAPLFVPANTRSVTTAPPA